MLYDKKISVIIPCRDEEAALYSMLSKAPSYIDEIIVVDNNSKDNTAEVARTFKAKVVTEKRKMNGVGYGYAHQSGMKHATGDIIIALDGDDTYPIEGIRDIVSYMEKSGADFVSCSRFPLADNKAISRTRQLGIKILNLQVSLLYGYQIKDILSGMWAIRSDAMSKIKPKKGDWNFSPEIKLSALMHPEVHFSEYHIAHAVRLNGLSKQNIWKTGMDHLFYIVGRRITIDSHATRQQIAYAVNTLSYIRRGFTKRIIARFSI